MTSPTLSVELVSIDSLIPDADNAKIHTPEQINEIVESIAAFGFNDPIGICGTTIVEGEGRWLAMKQMGATEIPAIRLDHLNEAQRRAYALAHNKLNAKTGLDPLKIKLNLTVIKVAGLDLKPIGFTPIELRKIFADPKKEAESTAKSLAEVESKEFVPFVQAGDIWTMGDHRMLCGDSLNAQHVEQLMQGEKADVVFTDPPYGYSYESNFYKDANPHGMLANDDKILDFMPHAFAAMADNAAIFVCASHQTVEKWKPLIEKHFAYKNLIVWKKNNWSMGDLAGAFAGQHELIFFAHKGRVTLRGERSRDVWEFDRDPPELHPTQKPVELVEFAISKVTDPGATCLDLFLGSGTTVIACEKLERKCVGMEIDPRYSSGIILRWADFTQQVPTVKRGERVFTLAEAIEASKPA